VAGSLRDILYDGQGERMLLSSGYVSICGCEPMESCQYRGYQIETRRLWSNWCVSVYRTRSDVPILPRPTLYTATPQMDEAVAEAKQSIDLLLSHLK
jgi:hypothetical protein